MIRLDTALTDEQFRVLFDAFPNDDNLIRAAVLAAVHTVSVPLKTGVWPRHGARVYYDDGFNGSGYLLVHWNDSGKVPGCLSNGYVPTGIPTDEIEWDENPARERALAIHKTMWSWV